MPYHEQQWSLNLTLPALSVLYLGRAPQSQLGELQLPARDASELDEAPVPEPEQAADADRRDLDEPEDETATGSMGQRIRVSSVRRATRADEQNMPSVSTTMMRLAVGTPHSERLGAAGAAEGAASLSYGQQTCAVERRLDSTDKLSAAAPKTASEGGAFNTMMRVLEDI